MSHGSRTARSTLMTSSYASIMFFFFFQAEDGIRDVAVTGVQTCALPIFAGKAGSFVLQRTGIFENGVAKESYFVIPGSGTGQLRGLRGEGTSAVGHGTEHPLTLHYELG